MLRHYFQWHIIHGCNLSCKHCYQEDISAMMSLNDMKFVLDKYEAFIKYHKYEGQINLTGGEPLLHPDFLAIAREIRNRNIRLGILTNGTLVDEEWADKIADLSPVFVQISLDGNQKVHDNIRGEGAFEASIKAIEHLKAQGVRVLVSFTAMRDNLDSFEELCKVCKAHKVDKLWWDRVVTDDENLFLSTSQFQSFSEKTIKLKRKFPFLSNDRALQGLSKETCGYQCSVGKRLLVVLANGDMMACRRLPFVIGNIFDEESLDVQLRQNEQMQQLCYSPIPIECRACKFVNKCKGGAKCVTYAQTGKLCHKDVNCYIPNT